MAPPMDDDTDQLSVDTPTRKSRRISARNKSAGDDVSVLQEEEDKQPPARRSTRKRKTDDDSVASSQGSRGSRTPKRSRAKKGAAAAAAIDTAIDTITEEHEEEEQDSKLPAVINFETNHVHFHEDRNFGMPDAMAAEGATIHVQNAEPPARSVPVAVDNIRLPVNQTPGKASKGTVPIRSYQNDESTLGMTSNNEMPRGPSLQLNYGGGGASEQGSATINIPVSQPRHARAAGLDNLLAQHNHEHGVAASDPPLAIQHAIAFRAKHSRTNSRNIDLDTTFTSFADVMETDNNNNDNGANDHPLARKPAARASGLDVLLGLNDTGGAAAASMNSHLVVQQESRAVAFRARHTRTNSRNIDLQTTFTSFTDVMETESVVDTTSMPAEARQAGDNLQQQQQLVSKETWYRRAPHYVPFWLALWLLVAAASASFAFPPIYSSMIGLSDAALTQCQAVAAWMSPMQFDPIHAQQTVSKLEAIVSLQKNVEAAKEELLTLAGRTNELNRVLNEVVAQRQTRFQQAAGSVTKTHSILQENLNEPNLLLGREEMDALREQLNSLDGVDQFLVDVSFIDSWVVPDTTISCNETKSILPEFDVKQFDSLVETLRREADTSVVGVMSDEFSKEIHSWVQENLEEEAQVFSEGMAMVPKPAEKQTIDTFAGLIRSRLELERADQTGKVDYASILNGASVIRSGKWATTLSLKDDLPLLNRMADVLGLRFYGHGPEMALTPVVPFAALGQCWSFQQHAGVASEYGVLSFKLAKPTTVYSVSIEHPPKEVTDRVNTAIRSFRLLGFEDDAASSEPWELGTFEYTITGAIRQEFEVARVVGERPVPELQSVALAIDSNWGAEYACLYRVRVNAA
ncbi:hypothetical protein MPSEU_000453400 [Mayamaea pseudoterrestris]|nr:hypothetical protein MPSEU_000453400 [Mayamaea pseudoterrestris]